ncbi:hypothetical protein J4450_04600 [Candidatus Micrarchaeota archaeon]|nr:hypothetical protein [Candidatus Micrarchaeota archaeon]
MQLPESPIRKKIKTTNTLANMLESVEPINFANNLNDIDTISSFKADWDVEKYEKKEKEIPELLYHILKKESNTFTKLVKRDYFEEDAWLVTINNKEFDYLSDFGHDLVEDIPPFVKIHVPKIFVRTLALPMIGNH